MVKINTKSHTHKKREVSLKKLVKIRVPCTDIFEKRQKGNLSPVEAGRKETRQIVNIQPF